MGDFSSSLKTAYPDRYSILKEYARKNRKNQTPCEDILWQQLRGRKLGVVFRRQHPIGDYIADFFCYEKKLVIEIDGKYHENSEQAKEDIIRSHDIECMGFMILRFTNQQVMMQTAEVIEKIRDILNNV